MAGLVLQREIDEVFDSALQEVAQRVLPLAYAELLARDTDKTTQRMAPVSAHREYITYVVRDKQGRELLQSSDADRLKIPPGLEPGFHTTERLRTYTETAVQGTIVVTTAEELDHRTHGGDACRDRAGLAPCGPGSYRTWRSMAGGSAVAEAGCDVPQRDRISRVAAI